MIRKQWVQRAGIVIVMLMVLAVSRVDAASKTLYVGTCHGTSRYTTIQSAVDAVNDTGFTIYICPGTYHESVTIKNKEKVTIRNYVVNNRPAPLIDPGKDHDGFRVDKTNKLTIRGLRITNAATAIYATNAPKIEVRNILVTHSRAGIVFETSEKGVIRQNLLSDVFFGTSTTFANNEVKDNTITLTEGGFGIGVNASDGTRIIGNTITGGAAGIEIYGMATHLVIDKNTTNFNIYGMTMSDQSSYNTISGHSAKGNTGVGIDVGADSPNNTFTQNLLQGNGTDVVDQTVGSQTAGTANTWTNTTCDTSTPAGLCNTPATSRVPNT